MEIRIYIGAHKTASKHLVNTLIINNEQLEEEGVVFFNRPGRAMRYINNAVKSISAGADKVKAIDELLHLLTEGRDAKRVLIIHPDMIGNLSSPIGKTLFYPSARKHIKKLHDVFEDHELRLYTSVRNPATFIPSCYAENALNASMSSYTDYINGLDLTDLRWSSLLHRIQDKDANVPLTVWRFEDYPYIWRDVAQVFAGLSNSQNLLGKTDRINTGLTLNGAQLLHQYIAKYGSGDAKNLETIKKIYLERFESSPNEIVGPDWPAETVGALTHNYDDDWYYIERMVGLQTIQARQI